MFSVRARTGGAAAGATTALLALIGAPAAQAASASTAAPPAMSTASVVLPMGASCGGITNPCGIVYNRTGATLQLSRDANSHFTCGAIGPYRDLPSGKNSNAYGSTHWPDVDCVRSRTMWIVTNGRVYPPGEWIRIWTSKWFYAA
ncbi:hypothetical protein IMZ11_24895 [Microtetraspora sp. AC03309]|uniref:hypothetical protein n=1 Tax=Microtetraspora sp. AC03309 TaxID=2779376 RepID=UPI001E4F271C|nr:hypothetical protein [Microtetraspora sp. AC03309]MCC5578869.1 hypothetical protein [Microtetraspora sp. AC03309]